MNEFKKKVDLDQTVRTAKVDLDSLARSIKDVADKVKVNWPFESEILRNIAFNVKIEVDRLSLISIEDLKKIAERIKSNNPFEANTLQTIYESFTIFKR